MKKIAFSILSIIMILSFCIPSSLHDANAKSEEVSKP